MLVIDVARALHTLTVTLEAARLCGGDAPRGVRRMHGFRWRWGEERILQGEKEVF